MRIKNATDATTNSESLSYMICLPSAPPADYSYSYANRSRPQGTWQGRRVLCTYEHTRQAPTRYI
jgi:hypothetical protein